MYTIVAQPTNVTIFTDMSHKDGLTGYAFYIRADNYKLTGSGCFETNNDSGKNEMYAIGKALQKLKAYHWKQVPIKTVYIYCDNQLVVNQLKTYARTKQPWASDKEYETKLIAFLNQFEYTIEARKVKAHTAGKCIRTQVNNWMDNMAREAREKYFQNKFGGLQK